MRRAHRVQLLAVVVELQSRAAQGDMDNTHSTAAVGADRDSTEGMAQSDGPPVALDWRVVPGRKGGSLEGPRMVPSLEDIR
jgi:hypothetical protein